MLIVDGILKKVEDTDIIDGFFAVPETVTVIEKMAFCDCNSLTDIYLPETIKQIKKYAFENCNNIKKLITPWGEVNVKSNSTISVYVSYIYLLANSLLKDKYDSIEVFLKNPYISGLISHKSLCNDDNNIEKFKNLFYKLRKKYDVNRELFMKLSLKTKEKFNLDSWNKIKKMLYFMKTARK